MGNISIESIGKPLGGITNFLSEKINNFNKIKGPLKNKNYNATKYFFGTLIMSLFEIFFIASLINKNFFEGFDCGDILKVILKETVLCLGIVSSSYFAAFILSILLLIRDPILKSFNFEEKEKCYYKKTIELKKQYLKKYFKNYFRIFILPTILTFGLAVFMSYSQSIFFLLLFILYFLELFDGCRFVSKYYSRDIFILRIHNSFPENFIKNCKFCLLDNNECYYDSSNEVFLIKRNENYIEFKLTLSEHMYGKFELVKTNAEEVIAACIDVRKTVNELNAEKIANQTSELIARSQRVINICEKYMIGYNA